MSEHLTEEQRDDVCDLLPLSECTIWSDDQELSSFAQWNFRKWLEVVGHPKAHPGCCKTCGCAATCMGGAFFDATVSTVLRELARLRLLRPASEAVVQTEQAS